MRVRTLIREPSALFWVFAFPLLTSLALGLAFRNRELSRLHVAVADGPEADAVARQLDSVAGLAAERQPLAEAREGLRRGRVALVWVPGPTPELVIDPTQPDGRTAKLMTVDALERMHGRADTLHPVERESTAPGSRYIDFLIPGLLGFGLMSSGLWGVGWALVQMRTARLLKRLVATPMRRSDFLLSFVLSRALLAVAEIAFFVGFSRLLFGVRVFGSVAGLGLFALAGALCFAGISLATSCRAQNSETASGLMNLVSMPMVVLSGVFFSASHFPAWTQPAIKLLPLTALNDGLRAIMVDGASIATLGSQALVLLVWGAGSFGFALRFFRWT
jgi:ABC-2 type transport system permease protein